MVNANGFMKFEYNELKLEIFLDLDACVKEVNMSSGEPKISIFLDLCLLTSGAFLMFSHDLRVSTL